MTVALLPPLTSGLGRWDGVSAPLLEAPRYVRTQGMSRWHRSRSGTRRGGTVSVGIWCGAGFVYLAATEPTRHGGIGVDEVPDGEPACGPCVGKALGAGQDGIPTGSGLPKLRYDPRWIIPPGLCTGSRKRELWEPLNARETVGRCLVCAELVTIRAVGRGYDAYGAGPVNHEPGPGLYEPCPFHAWNNPTKTPAGVACACGWPPAGPPEGSTTNVHEGQ